VKIRGRWLPNRANYYRVRHWYQIPFEMNINSCRRMGEERKKKMGFREDGRREKEKEA
jgi:hypothetical protein